MSQQQPSVRKTNIAALIVYGLPGLFAGVILSYALTLYRGEKKRPLAADKFEVDANHDGKVDSVTYYSDGFISRAEEDRNFDGAFDHWYWYSEHVVVRSEADTNFDGSVDAWDTYRHGTPVTGKADTDWNGLPDVTVEFEHGLPKKSSWHPNGSKIIRVEFFKHGLLTHEEIDSDGDGDFETQRRYDAFGNQLPNGTRAE